ncbi:MAG TPA: HAD-IA family hydrolase [Blastocatellia bacterium]|jgi:HAD superfamily hydrolase (TIGR01509 family)|nr:HAD-IA family hydrolase [Blastocatellia bacterium]
MQNDIQWVVFDLGGVVVKLDADGALEELARRSATDKNLIKSFLGARDESNLSPDEKLSLGLLEVDDYIALLNRTLRRKLTREEIIDLRLQVIQGEDDDVLEIIRVLSTQRKVACFSNTHALHWDHMLANYRSFRIFHCAVASHLIHAAKPDPRAFAIVCRELEAEPAECLFIDDSLANAEAARAAGWHAIHFKGAAALREELREYGLVLSE